MTPPPRTIELVCHPGRERDFATALERWAAAEPLLAALDVGPLSPRRITATLMPLFYGHGEPLAGQLAPDRERAAAVLRAHVPADLVESGTIEGADWRE